MKQDFHVTALSRESFDIWKLSEKESGITKQAPDVKVRRIGSTGYWAATANVNGTETQIRAGKSRGGCILAGLEHLS